MIKPALPLTAPVTVPKGHRSSQSTSSLNAWLWGLAGIVLMIVLWEGYKFLAPADGIVIGETRIAPRTSDLAMPHSWDMLTRMLAPTTGSPTADPLWLTVLLASLTTLWIAGVGWLIAIVVGMSFALIMLGSRIAEWALGPWIILSQTVPLIAFAPIVHSWGSQIEIGDFRWEQWMSVALIASYLAFFPIAIGALKGLQSPDTIHTELMHTYGVGWWKTLVRLRLPASVPFLLPSLRLAAANAVVGVVVAEVSIGMQGGIGRLLIQFAGQASGDPAKAWGPIFGAVALGLLAAGSVALLGTMLKNYRRVEVNQ